MSETSNTDPIRAAEIAKDAQYEEPVIEYREARASNDRPTEWELACWEAGYRRGAKVAADAVSATLTETEADLQASRGREQELRAAIARVAVARANHPVCEEHPDGDTISCGWKRAVIDIDAALSAVPSPTLEAVKADTTTEQYMTHFCNPFCPSLCEQFGVRFSRQVTEWVPVETGGESRG